MTQSVNQQPLEFLRTLGSVCQYRDPDHIERAVKQIGTALSGLEAELASQDSPRDRSLFALDVMAELLTISRSRASACEQLYPDVACENLDMSWIMGEWIRIARERIAASAMDI